MNTEQLFIKILEKAIKNGWDICGFLKPNNCDTWQQGVHQWQNVVDLQIFSYGKMRTIQLDTIIFNHDFAKAFFGEQPTHWKEHHYQEAAGMIDFQADELYHWQWCLQQMALVEDRLQYLKGFLEQDKAEDEDMVSW